MGMADGEDRPQTADRRPRDRRWARTTDGGMDGGVGDRQWMGERI